ncbi:MAG: SDR family oxidoreductase [Bdellovibrionaceae bacterium]|nr:SDR family oxidoreductase [Pseudobdellovibrionaceae bacterium]
MKSPGSKNKVFIIGGRRGLGKNIADHWKRECPEDTVQTSSRTVGADYLCDLSQEESVSELLKILDREQPKYVFCIPGGGPYGKFSAKEWKDHSWGLSVTLLAPMRITHHLLRSAYCEQIILVGSAIAESSADPNAASYCAAKHGLKGFASTLVEEVSGKDIRLFSPGYMATDMLPANAAVKTGKTPVDPMLVAREFVQWARIPKAAWHKVYTP